MSGDEFAKVRKRLRTNSKKLPPRYNNPVQLPHARRRLALDRSRQSLHLIRGVPSITKRRKSITTYYLKDTSNNRNNLSKASCVSVSGSGRQYSGERRSIASECHGRDSLTIVPRKSTYELTALSADKSLAKIKSEAFSSPSRHNIRGECKIQEIDEKRSVLSSSDELKKDDSRSMVMLSTSSKGSNAPTNINEEEEMNLS